MQLPLRKYIEKNKYDLEGREESLFMADKLITYLVLSLVGTLIFALGIILYFILAANIKFNLRDEVDGPGQIGDIIGGVSAPIIGLIGALLTFLAFWIQFSFNKYQTIKIEQQGKDAERNRFEGLFYEMLRIHRDNVSEITIKDVSKNRRAFISMFKEFKFCYYVLMKVYTEYRIENKDFILDDQKLVNIGFIAFFFGLGESSEDIVNSLLIHYKEDFRVKYYNELERYQNEWLTLDEEIKKQKKISIINAEDHILKSKRLTISIQIDEYEEYKLTAAYKPFAGHLARLGHYFRHLFQTVEFIERQDPPAKDEYIRILRAQISAHEQLLLYYNSLTVMGKSWWTKEFIKNYRIIKNIPLPLANIRPIPTDKLDVSYFEWSEITNSLEGGGII